jgi:CBS domain-containing protein
MARAEGIGTGSITLYIFGGLATLEKQPARPSSEFKIAIVGPAASFLVGTIFFGLAMALQGFHRGSAQVLRHLGVVNWFLAGFNILPGLPLDGGRVLRAVLWQLTKSYRAATRTAIRAGLTIALALLAAGVYLVLSRDFNRYITGVWSVAIGAMLLLILLTTERRARPRRNTVEEVMARDVVLVPPEMRIDEFVENILRNNRQTVFPVGQDRRLHGMLLLADLKSAPRSKWPELIARDVMRPVDESMFIPSCASLAEAREKLAQSPAGCLIVVDSNGLIVGNYGVNSGGIAPV